MYPFAVTGWIIGLSQIVDATTVAYVTLVAVLVYYAAFTIVGWVGCRVRGQQLKRQSASMGHIVDERQRLGTRFAETLRLDSGYYRHIKWVENIKISQGGDTLIERDLVIEAGARGIDLAFHNLFANKPVADKSQVSFEAFIVRPGGEEIEATFLPVWEDEKKYSTFVILDRTYSAGEQVRVRARWQWPGYSVDLMSGKPEPHSLKMSRSCDEFVGRIEIMKVDWFKTHRVVTDALTLGKVSSSCITTKEETPDSYVVNFSAQNQLANGSFGIQLNSVNV